jgi:hypothetical protein
MDTQNKSKMPSDLKNLFKEAASHHDDDDDDHDHDFTDDRPSSKQTKAKATKRS